MRSRHRSSFGARLLTTKLLATASIVAVQGIALAQNSTQTPPPSAEKIGGGGADGDPSGAVRALGSGSDDDKGRKPTVTVPRLGGQGENRTGGVPSGTSGGTRR